MTLDDPTLTSPIIMSMRSMDDSRNIKETLELAVPKFQVAPEVVIGMSGADFRAAEAMAICDDCINCVFSAKCVRFRTERKLWTRLASSLRPSDHPILIRGNDLRLSPRLSQRFKGEKQ